MLTRYGHVDVLVNNACFSKGGLLGGCSYDDFLEVLRVGVAAPYELARLFMDRFGEGGAIVNIASTRAEQSMPDTESYSAAKGGIVALTHAMAMSMASRGIRVNCISPGWIQTEAAGAALSKRTRCSILRVVRACRRMWQSWPCSCAGRMPDSSTRRM